MDVHNLLIKNVAEGRCFAFIGAGFSLNASLPDGRRMPDWDTLTKILADHASVDIDLGGPEVASCFVRLFRRSELYRVLRDALHFGIAQPGPAHEALASIEFDIICTTNFDSLLEEAHKSSAKIPTTIVGDMMLSTHGGPFETSIIKIHGDLEHNELVITEEDYDSYLTTWPATATYLSCLMFTKSPIFIGYSMRDSNFIQIRNVVRERLGDFVPSGYFIGFDLDSEQEQNLIDDGLVPISLITESKTKGEVLAEFLESLNQQMHAKRVASQRARDSQAFESVENLERIALSKDSSILLSASSKICFISHSMSKETKQIVDNFVLPIVRSFGLEARTPDRILKAGSIVDLIQTTIQQSKLVIYIIDSESDSINYESKVALKSQIPSVFIVKSGLRISSFLPKEVYVSIKNGIYPKVRFDSKNTRGLIEKIKHAIDKAIGFYSYSGIDSLIVEERYLEAVARLGILLDFSLRRLGNEYEIIARAPRMATFGYLAHKLKQVEIISSDDNEQIQRFSKIRNRVIRGEKEPTNEETSSMLGFVEEFIEKYLPEKYSKVLDDIKERQYQFRR